MRITNRPTPGTTPETRQGMAATRLREALVELNKKAKTGSRTLTFRIGSKGVQTDEALRALQGGNPVKATVVTFKSVRGGKFRTDILRAKVRVRDIKVTTLDSVMDLAAFARKNVFDANKAKGA